MGKDIGHKVTLGPIWCGCCGWAMENVGETNHLHCVNSNCEIFGKQYQMKLYMNEVQSVGQSTIPGVKNG